MRFRTGKDTKEDEIVAGPGYPDLQPRPQGFSLHPFFKGKALGTRLPDLEIRGQG